MADGDVPQPGETVDVAPAGAVPDVDAAATNQAERPLRGGDRGRAEAVDHVCAIEPVERITPRRRHRRSPVTGTRRRQALDAACRPRARCALGRAMTQDRALSIGASVVGALAAIWYYRDVAKVTASHGPVAFPLLPAIIAATSILLALYLGTRDRPEE